jgi:hypothetical protein
LLQQGATGSVSLSLTTAVCPSQPTTQARQLQVRERDHYEVLQAAPQRQQTEPFKEAYARRAGSKARFPGARGSGISGGHATLGR